MITVIGDIMIDKYTWGSVYRISPEAPVPVVNVRNIEYRLGGAANVAANIASLGNSLVSLHGYVGTDDEGYKALMSLLRNYKNIKVHTNWFLNAPTIIKNRIMGERQQLLRIDFEEKFQEEFENKNKGWQDSLSRSLEQSRIVVVSDYGKGVICRENIDILRKAPRLTLVDPFLNNTSLYKNDDILFPNSKEYNEIKMLLDITRFSTVVETRGPEGIRLHIGEVYEDFPAQAKEVYDVTGAGDTVIAAIAVCLDERKSIEEAIQFANKAAGIAVSKTGTYVVSRKEVETL